MEAIDEADLVKSEWILLRVWMVSEDSFSSEKHELLALIRSIEAAGLLHNNHGVLLLRIRPP